MGSLIESIQEEYFDRGENQGIEQGIEQNRKETAENLLRHGHEYDVIYQATSLDREQVEAIRKTLTGC